MNTSEVGREPWGIQYVLDEVWRHIERGEELLACQLLFPEGVLVGVALAESESNAFAVLHRLGRHAEALELAARLLQYYTAEPVRLLWHFTSKVIRAYGWALHHNGQAEAVYLFDRTADLLTERRIDEVLELLARLPGGSCGPEYASSPS